MTVTDLIGGFLTRPKPRCDEDGPEFERCLLEPRHEGFHKSNRRIWPNERDPLDWAEIGRHLLTVGPLPHLSLREMEYAVEAYRRTATGDVE